MCLVIPGQLIFFFIIYFVSNSEHELTFWTALFYIIAAFIQVGITMMGLSNNINSFNYLFKGYFTFHFVLLYGTYCMETEKKSR